ncbi:MAG: 3-deoxy-7-phosphoheptulonate synthase [Candidatus Chloroheliales bacterium]|nr:MAG: 3-deoxy-7-phosphoheptulonate synthase [Chloroflexota bacterium]
MIIVMKYGATQEQIDHVVERVKEHGFTPHLSEGEQRAIIGVVGSDPDRLYNQLMGHVETLGGVEQVVPITKKYKLSSREFQPANTVVDVDGVKIGGEELVVMAGPCSVESEEQLISTAKAVKAAGAKILRGGAFKPRTSPYQFRGLGKGGLELLAQARAETGLKVITEVLTPGDVDLVAQYSDILQIGARNMQNFLLLEEVGKAGKPCLLKRGLSATIEEWLLSAEYILATGNRQVMLCERGIRTFETYTRNTMDISAIPVIKKLSHLPIIADPSHGTGKWYLVPPLALASVAAGADGLIIEVHPDPDKALSDGPQSLNPENFAKLMPQISWIAAAVGRSVDDVHDEFERYMERAPIASLIRK